MSVETDLRVPAEDGAALATDVYRGDGTGRRPVVLLRTYLDKSRHAGEAVGWARRGFVCAVQDVRGRYGSEGDWRPYTAERADGRATVQWLLAQPWCDGRVVAVGGSYGALTAWCAAVEHPAVRAVISSVPAMRPMPLQPEDGGVLPLLSRAAWWTTHAGVRRVRAGAADAVLKHSSHLLRGPVVDLPEFLGTDWPGWREAVLATELENAAEPVPAAELAGLDVASLHLGGWHDPFCAETLRQFELVGRSRDPRPPRTLVMGPWWHHLDGRRPARYGERSYGDRSRFPLGAFQADWLTEALSGSSKDTSLQIFLGGENRWIEAEEWTCPAVETSTWFAAAGRLEPSRPRVPGKASVNYDPDDPHPCRRTPLDESGLPPRTDVLVYTGPPLEHPLPVIGTPRMTLWGVTEARSVDWVVRLLEVTADGRRLYLAHGLVDAAGHLAARGERLRPGVPHRVEIQLSPLGVTLPAGSRLRLEVANSAFPSYARNPGSGESRLVGGVAVRSRQTVYWGPEHGTALELPVHLRIPDARGIPADPPIATVSTHVSTHVSDRVSTRALGDRP